MPIASYNPITTGMVDLPSLFDNNAVKTEDATAGFSDIFSNIYGEMIDTQNTVQADAIQLINGDIDDLHTIYNDMTKAQIAVETFVAVKNAAVDAFQRIMQTQM
jgi:flagellar hook-basal body complex protein FliE